jgi:hypothetical protein
MKVASADSSCSLVWLGARAACVEVSTEPVETLKTKHGHKVHVDPVASFYGPRVYTD